MIGRRSTKELARLLLKFFSKENTGGRIGERWVPWDPVYDFLYERDFDAPLCNAAEQAAHGGCRSFEEFILRLHTAESVASLRKGQQGLALVLDGQAYIRALCEAVLDQAEEVRKKVEGNSAGAELLRALRAFEPFRGAELLRALELDGYVYRDGKLLHVESAIVDVETQHSALQSPHAR